jgi:hypothetical protein
MTCLIEKGGAFLRRGFAASGGYDLLFIHQYASGFCLPEGIILNLLNCTLRSGIGSGKGRGTACGESPEGKARLTLISFEIRGSSKFPGAGGKHVNFPHLPTKNVVRYGAPEFVAGRIPGRCGAGK